MTHFGQMADFLRSIYFQMSLLTYFCLINNVDTIYTCPVKCSVMKMTSGYASAKNNETSFSRDDEKFAAYRREKCRFYSDTVKCVNRSLDFTVRGRPKAEPSPGKAPDEEEDDFLTLPPCDPDDAHVTLSPYLDQSGGGGAHLGQSPPPIVRLNVTLRVLDSRAIQAVAIRMTCLENGPGYQGQEFLCNDHSRPDWARFYWPCRMFDWSPKIMTFDHSKRPIGIELARSQTFSHDCFRAGAALALMRAHVVLYPKACLLNYTYRVPPADVISGWHSIFVVENWIPFLYVDTAAGQKNGSITVHYTLPPVHTTGKEVKALVVELIDQGSDHHSSDTPHFTNRVETIDLSLDSRTSLTFHDLPPGRYLAVVRLQADWCQSDPAPDPGGHVLACRFTYVPFNLTNHDRPRLLPSKSSSTTGFGKMPDSFKWALTIVGCLFLASCAIFAFYGAKLWRWWLFRRHNHQHQHRSTSMTAVASNRSKTDVIYLPKLAMTEE